VNAAKRLYQSRLARAILANDGVNLSGMKSEVNATQHKITSEGLGQAYNFEKRSAFVSRHLSLPSEAAACPVGQAAL